MPDSAKNVDFATITESLKRIALAAGKEIMTVYAGEIAVEMKDDKSPVTEADARGEAIIISELQTLAPDIPIIAEESASAGNLPETGSIFFLVDPLDGTKEFINRNGEFTVNIALIVDGVPEAGVVYAPALSRMFYAVGRGQAFECQISPDTDARDLVDATTKSLKVRQPDKDGLIVVASRSHRSPETEEYLKDFNVKDFVAAGSSLKFCLLAAGEADLYPRHGRTMEWDTGAGHAVLRGAGGTVTGLDGSPFLYGKRNEGFANPFFVAEAKAR